MSKQAIFVTLRGQRCTIQVAPGDSVLVVKTKAAAQLNMTESCKVVCHGWTLDNHANMYDLINPAVNYYNLLEVKRSLDDTDASTASKTTSDDAANAPAAVCNQDQNVSATGQT
jgi:hypothetical protein